MLTDANNPAAQPAVIHRGIKWFQFMASGLPSFLLAVPLNYVLVEWAHWNKSLTYGLLLAMQVAINFFVCRRWVFGRRDAHSLWSEFGAFFSGIMGFRLADWLLYTVLVQFFGLYFLAVQLGNVLLFSVLKFLFSERLFKAKRQP
jgi:putative flippase GtrA